MLVKLYNDNLQHFVEHFGLVVGHQEFFFLARRSLFGEAVLLDRSGAGNGGQLTSKHWLVILANTVLEGRYFTFPPAG